MPMRCTLAAKPAAGYTMDEVPMVINRSQLSRAELALLTTSLSRSSPNLQASMTSVLSVQSPTIL